ncbi:sigma-54-dependent Fis family transcriptional regulator [Photobacterium galatheae]|uniref:Fis family transcriptional regulator n=1 Tax=Photobacterium galatheae TaxID=1654360 RepID=A0A066RMV0_9GAMM|nr:sigma-54-dependent Fis family transcriptional regulator [Photobacterium galatheae]KDM91765.1 Fis family transcriptional regulator [Photobacterium galatheae]MCM0147142.1 sigma-54-dependent Fis family transcriptional regulator [Photobacterium galatheae]
MPTLASRIETDWLSESWNRCQMAGLRESQRPDNIRLENTQLDERRSNAADLIAAVEHMALPLFNQVFAGTNSRLLLGDTEGIIIQSWGQSRFEQRLTGIALESGVCWQEGLKGTNAIGNALTEKQFITVVGDQHFIRQHRFISCSAGPVFSSSGELIGVLDITSEQQVHSEQTRLFVQHMVQLVENTLLCHLPEASLRIDLACDQSLLQTGWQGILVANEQGQVLAHNRIAERLLGQRVSGRQVDELVAESRRGTRNPPSLVFHKQVLQPARRQTRVAGHSLLSPSCPLHFGDDRVELAWQQACKLVDKDISLLVLGETGVGKGAFVKQLHRHSARRHAPLVSINCGALPQNLIESELFGYVPGAFTGASRQGQPGRIRQADQGILFLDEIADMPLSAQTRLLHVLQDKEVIPVGATQPVKVDIRIIAATHKDLTKAVAEGQFREDLYYRLNGLILSLPPLRERQDKAELIEAILLQYCDAPLQICPELSDRLAGYHWPGNIRELDNMLKVAAVLAEGDTVLTLAHLPQHFAAQLPAATHAGQPSKDLKKLEATISGTLLETYQANQGNISRTAKILGISRNTLYRRLRKLGIQV